MRLAACLFVRDEADDIAEWLAFHHLVGVDHVMVFDNLSRDGTRAAVQRAAKQASIRLLPWPVTDRRAQKLAYAVALWWLRRFDWVAFLDADEFLVPTGSKSVKTVLASLPPDASAVAINWAMFGSSGHEAPPERMIIEAFTRRADDDFFDHRMVKSIVRPRRVRALNPHAFTLKRGTYVRPDGTPVSLERDDRTVEPADYGLLQVSHYFTRSRAHWRCKMARGYRDIERPEFVFDKYDRNEREDRLAVRFAEAVRAELKRRGQG